MTVERLIALLLRLPGNCEVYVNSPDNETEEDYFIEGVSINNKLQVFIETAQ